jgi:hypothetical protein
LSLQIRHILTQQHSKLQEYSENVEHDIIMRILLKGEREKESGSILQLGLLRTKKQRS